MQNTDNKKIVVIGTEIVGICCAVSALKKGFQVTLLISINLGKALALVISGIICRGGILPYSSPKIRLKLRHYALDQDPRFLLNWKHFFFTSLDEAI